MSVNAFKQVLQRPETAGLTTMTDVNIIGPDGNDSSFIQIRILLINSAVRRLPVVFTGHLH
jgi:hypothetical protein